MLCTGLGHMSKIPVSVIVVTKNEERFIARCLSALVDFSDVTVVDSCSDDKTCEIALDMGVRVIQFQWDGKYPKKRQWCLDHIRFENDWVFWVDADEVVMPALINEMRNLFLQQTDFCGFFVKGQYVWGGTVLRYGLRNNKIALFNKNEMEFPVVNDLECSGMGEIEGHYQPVLKGSGHIGQLNATLLHYADDCRDKWDSRHQRYARWEVCMTRKCAWPKDPILWRDALKRIFRRSALKPFVMFLHCYIIKRGFLDGRRGYDFALHRKQYYDLVYALLKKDFSV